MSAVETSPNWYEQCAKAYALKRALEDAARYAITPHRDHHTHLSGNIINCSCGEYLGIISIVLPRKSGRTQLQKDLAKMRCETCGDIGVMLLKKYDG